MVSADASDITVALTAALSDLNRDRPGRLAYLAATAKAENPIRDELAVRLHSALGDRDSVIAREWDRRYDLAILNRDGSPRAVLEAKALYSFDVVAPVNRSKFLHGDAASHQADHRKLASAIEAGVSCYLLSLVTHLGAVIPPELVGVIKYAAAHNRACAQFDSPDALYAAARRWSADLTCFGPHAHEQVISHDLGIVYGVPIRVDCYLLGPLTAPIPDGGR